ncbi:hypothetical protein [Desulfosporosinus sp. FKA]|uniref:hypothetical protein n=1 Tax=Desulfosporosinus sp. FKA TaxID=1969834 RepID=UPI000B49FC60|nr:hypothetical protein [Desulfosporosinus sp. FKA]
MKIEHIKGSRLKGLGNITWTFPASPAYLLFKEQTQQQSLIELLLKLFSPQTPQGSMKLFNNISFLELVFSSDENNHCCIRQNYLKENNDFIPTSALIKDEITGQNVLFTDSSVLGEYIFDIKLQPFQLGVIVNWSDNDDLDQLRQRIDNLCQSGDEELSPLKVKACLSGAMQKLNEQKGKMALVKAKYDTLRQEWEDSRRQQEEERLLVIEINKFQEGEAILANKIDSTLKIQERLSLLNQNPDYRELRRLQTEIMNSEEEIGCAESNLAALTSDSIVDWGFLESLREECIEWADLQARVNRYDHIIQKLTDMITKHEIFLETCGYEGSNEEKERMSRLYEERNSAQEQLQNSINLQEALTNTRLQYSKEITHLQQFAEMAAITEDDQYRVERWEKQLKKWQTSKISRPIDRTLKNHLGRKSIEEKLKSRLNQFYARFHVQNSEALQNRLMKFRNQKKIVETIQEQITQLQNKIDNEEALLKIVHSRNELLNRAFFITNAADFSSWLDGWNSCNRKRLQLSHLHKKRQTLIERSKIETKTLHSFTIGFQEKLIGWNIPVTDREDVLTAIFKAAHILRTKDRAERRLSECSAKLQTMLSNRSLDDLSKKLEPLAELEKEALILDENRLASLTSWQTELSEMSSKRLLAEQHLKLLQKRPSLVALEEEIETVKKEWMSYESLLQAFNDAQNLFETSMNTWQVNYGNALKYEAAKILREFFNQREREEHQSDLDIAKSEYFAYRMAIAQLALNYNTNVPMIFSIGKMSDDQSLWNNIIEYLTDLSRSRQIILTTTNLKVIDKLKGVGWTQIAG